MTVAVTIVLLNLFVAAQTITDLQLLTSSQVGACDILVSRDRLQYKSDAGTHTSFVTSPPRRG